MAWTNLALIPTTEGWQYTEPFEGDYVRIRHLLGADKENLPYGFTGFIAQAFDFTQTVELFRIVKVYPYNQEDIFEVINPFPGQERRLAVRGQRKYQTSINWRMVIDVWNVPDAPDNSEISQSLAEIQEHLLRLPIIEQKLDQLLANCSEQSEQSEAIEEYIQAYYFKLL